MTQEFEDGKSVEEYVADLDSIVIAKDPFPEVEQRLETVVEEPVRNKKDKPKPQAQPEPKAEIPVVASEPVVDEPKISEPVEPQEVIPSVNVPSSIKRFSFDEVLSRAVLKKQALIDEEAARQKKMVEDRVYERMFAFIEAATNDAVQPLRLEQPQPTVQVEAKPEVKVEQSAAKPIEEPKPVPAPKIKGGSKGFSGKVAVALFGLTVVAGLAIMLTLNMFHLI